MFKRIKRLSRRGVRHLGRMLGPRVHSVQWLNEGRFLERTGYETAPGLIGHIGARLSDGWPAIPDAITDLRIDLSRMTDEEIIARADAALDNDLHPSGVRPVLTGKGTIDWSSNPSNSREWLLMMHRHGWWPLWGAAYQRTGDEKYARAFVSQMLDWIDSNPMPKYKSEDSSAWRLMETGLRMRISWIPSFGCFFDSESFSDAAKLKMLRAFYDHGRFLNTFYTNRNHLVRESNGLLALGLNFPEFTDSSTWVESAVARLEQEIRGQVNTDGSHLEMSVGYQWLTVIEFEITRGLLRDGQREGTIPALNDTLRKLYELLAAVIRPDGTFPQLNDGFILWDADYLAEIGRQSGWSDIEYVGSGGESGTQPDYCSRSFPNAGLHVMRSDWSAGARYLVADTGPYGGPHGHEDKLSFELTAYGAQFIVDPGSYTYVSSDPYRNYFVGSQGHNTVLVDGCSQVRRWNKTYLTPAVEDAIHGAWRSDAGIDAASGYYDEGYGEFAIVRPAGAEIISGVTHARDFVFARPDYWLVADHLVSGDAHDYSFLFHLAPDAVVEDIGPGSATIRSPGNGARLLIQALTEHSLRGEVIDGWYSEDHHRKCEAPVLQFMLENTATAFVTWLLYPLRPEADSPEVSATIGYDETERSRTVRVNYPGQSDVLRLPDPVPSDPAEMAARAAAISLRRGAVSP